MNFYRFYVQHREGIFFLLIYFVHHLLNKCSLFIKKDILKKGLVATYFIIAEFIVINIPHFELMNIVKIDVFNIALVIIVLVLLIPLKIFYRAVDSELINKIIDIIFYITAMQLTTDIYNNSIIRNIDKANYLLFILTVYLIFLMRRNFKIRGKDKFNEKLDVEIQEYDKLFNTRKVQADIVLNYLKSIDYTEPFAIALNGEWGKGKTSFIRAIKSKLTEEHYVIFINTMTLNTKEKLIKKFHCELKKIFKENNFYVGFGSSLKKYFDYMRKLLGSGTGKQVIDVIDNILGDKDIADEKEQIEKYISILRKESNKRIYIVVDDMDRTDIKSIESTLVFVKEIINFKECTIIFLIDYKELEKKKYSVEFLDKFINKTFDLVNVEFKDMIEYYINNNVYLNKFYYDKNNKSKFFETFEYDITILKSSISSYIENDMESMNKYINKFKNELENNKVNENKTIENDKENKTEKYTQLLEEFTKKINNPRSIKKLLREIEDCYILIFELNILFYTEKKHIQDIKLNWIIYVFACLKTIFRTEFENIKKYNDLKKYMEEGQANILRIMLNTDGLKIISEDSIDKKRIELLESIINYDSKSLDLRLKTEIQTEKLDKGFNLNKDKEDVLINYESYLMIAMNTYMYGLDICKERCNTLFTFLFNLYPNFINFEKLLSFVLNKNYYITLRISEVYLDKLIQLSDESKGLFESQKSVVSNTDMLSWKISELFYRQSFDLMALLTLYKDLYGIKKSKDLIRQKLFDNCESAFEFNDRIYKELRDNEIINIKEPSVENEVQWLSEFLNLLFERIESSYCDMKENSYIKRYYFPINRKLIKEVDLIKKLEKLKINISKGQHKRIYLRESSQELIYNLKGDKNQMILYYNLVHDNLKELYGLKQDDILELTRVCMNLIIVLNEKEWENDDEDKLLAQNLLKCYKKLELVTSNYKEFWNNYFNEYQRWEYVGVIVETFLHKISNESN